MMPCKEAGVWHVAVAAGEGNLWVYDGDKVDGEKKIVQIDMWIDSSFSFEKLLERVWQVSGLAPEGLVGASAGFAPLQVQHQVSTPHFQAPAAAC